METLSDLLTNAMQDELLELRERSKTASFRIGDITNEAIKAHPTAMLGRIHMAVGIYAGKSARTVREYAAISDFYPEWVRRKYEVLAYDHFRVAMRLGDQWDDALDWAVAQTDVLNRPATVDEMEEAFGEGQPLEEQEEEEDKRLLLMIRRIIEQLQIKDVGLDREIVIEGVNVLSKLENALELLIVSTKVS